MEVPSAALFTDEELLDALTGAVLPLETLELQVRLECQPVWLSKSDSRVAAVSGIGWELQYLERRRRLGEPSHLQ